MPQVGPLPEAACAHGSRRNVLVVGVTPAEYRETATLLQRHSLEVDRFPGAEGALELVSRVHFDVVILRHPLAGMPTRRFLETLRHDRSPCRDAAVVLLADPASQKDAEALFERGADRVLSATAAAARIDGAVSEVLDLSPRKSARLMVRLEVRLSGHRETLFCQTVNLSATGALLETDHRWPIGTRLETELQLPGQEAVACSAEVIRYAAPGVAGAGVGVRFSRFTGQGEHRLRMQLLKIAADDFAVVPMSRDELG